MDRSINTTPDSENMTEVDRVLQQWDEAKSARLPFEDNWSEISRWCAPRRITEIYSSPGDPLSHALTDTTAVNAAERSSSLVFGYLFGGREPFAIPRLVSRDKTSLEEDSWFDAVATRMHNVFRSSDVTFRATMMETLFDQWLYGTGNVWTGGGLGQLPRYRSTPLFDFWKATDENGQIERAFRRFNLSASEAARLYKHPSLIKRAAARPSERLQFLMATVPRQSGKKGGAVRNRPVAEYVIGLDDTVLLSESGYDQNPFSVGHLHKRPGEEYGYGCGHVATPTAKWLNRIYGAVISGAEKAIDPPLFDMTNGAFPDFDRRAGAVNMGTFEALGFSNVNQALQPIGPTSDMRPGVEIMNLAKSDILRAFYIDWMEVSGGPRKSAAEIYDNRDLRFKSLSGFVADTENNLAGPVIDRTFGILESYGAFPPMPDSLRGEDMDFEFRSPLAASMDQGDVEAMVRTLQFAEPLMSIDPTIADRLDGDGMLVQAAGDYGMKRGLLRPDADVEEIQTKRAEQQAKEAEAAEAQAAASALRDGAQGVASLENAGAGG